MSNIGKIIGILLLVFGGGCTIVAFPYVLQSLTELAGSSGSGDNQLVTGILGTATGLWLVGGLLPIVIGILLLRRKTGDKTSDEDPE